MEGGKHQERLVPVGTSDARKQVQKLCATWYFSLNSPNCKGAAPTHRRSHRNDVMHQGSLGSSACFMTHVQLKRSRGLLGLFKGVWGCLSMAGGKEQDDR